MTDLILFAPKLSIQVDFNIVIIMTLLSGKDKELNYQELGISAGQFWFSQVMLCNYKILNILVIPFPKFSNPFHLLLY